MGILVVLIIIGGVALALIEEPLRAYAKREFTRCLAAYTFTLGRLDLHRIGLSIDLENAKLVQNEHPDPPLAEIPRWHASIHWRELLRAHLGSGHLIDQPAVHLILSQIKKEAKDEESVGKKGWQQAVLAVYPLTINMFRVQEGDVTYRDHPEATPLHISHLNLNVRAETFGILRPQERTYPSPVHLDAQVFDTGRVTLDGSADFLSEPQMGVNVDVVLEQIRLDDLSPVTGRVNMQLRQGLLSARGHVEYSPYAQEVKLTDLLLEGVQPNYVHMAATKRSEKHVARKTAQAAEQAANHPELKLEIDRGKILNSEFGFINKATKPPYRVHFADTNISLENVSNHLSEGTAHIKLTGKFMGSGLTQATGTFRPETKSPDFDLQVRMVKTKMEALNDLLRAHGQLDVAHGVFAVFTEMKVKDGRVEGYVKPLFKDVDVYRPDQDRDKGLVQKAYEGVIGGITAMLKNTPRDEVATTADVSGPVKNPKTNTWEVVVKLIQNALFWAILPGFEKEGKRT